VSDWIVYTIGFTAQILFSGRLLVQWILSEKNKKVITPSLFWKLSLIASFLLFVYGYLRDDFAIMLGQSLTYFIYIRNLHLQGEWQRSPFWIRLFLIIFPFLIVIYAYNNGEYDMYQLFNNEDIPLWLLILGVISQIISMDLFRKDKSVSASCRLLEVKRIRSLINSNLCHFQARSCIVHRTWSRVDHLYQEYIYLEKTGLCGLRTIISSF
jgi:lipid-A-disaccharide synthase-like uncharacterized protein